MFFRSDYNDLMTPEPEVEKTGLARFAELAGKQLGGLLVVNVLFLLGCVPVVTIPLSLFALNRVMRRIVLDRPVGCFRDYWGSFRRDWRQAYPAFLLTALPLVCAGCGAWFYLSRAASNPLLLLPFLVCSTVFLVTLLSCGYLYGLLDGGKSVKEAVRLALLLGVGRPLRGALAAVCMIGLPVLAVLFFPLSVSYLLLLGFSLPCLLGNFYLRTVLGQYADREEAQNMEND